MKVMFKTVGRMDDAWYGTLDMPVVPRVGDTVQFDVDAGPEYEVHHIMWTPLEANYQAYVVLR